MNPKLHIPITAFLTRALHSGAAALGLSRDWFLIIDSLDNMALRAAISGLDSANVRHVPLQVES